MFGFKQPPELRLDAEGGEQPWSYRGTRKPLGQVGAGDRNGALVEGSDVLESTGGAHERDISPGNAGVAITALGVPSVDEDHPITLREG